MNIEIIVAVGLALLIVVLIRSAMTLADISQSLERIADSRQEVQVSMQSMAPGDTSMNRRRTDLPEPVDSEIAAVIAVARAAMDGSVKIAS
jgi:hypothetical protein